MDKKDKIKVGISVGDLNGIGIEVILKTFADSRMLDFCTPVIFAGSKVLGLHKKALNINVGIHGISHLDKAVHNKLNALSLSREVPEVKLGTPTEISGAYALRSLARATEALKSGEIDVLVTAPIDKHNMPADDFGFKGHTEYLESELGGESLMILMTEGLRVGLVTGHVPVKEVSAAVSRDLIEKKAMIMYQSLKNDFGISKPRMALLGLNPHCGDQGVIGTEDDEVVRPAVKSLQESGKLIYGPYSADSFFGSRSYEGFDGVLAMYHDQGLAPFKTIAFGLGVNYTAGLDRIRTSPDHGTAYDIAGKGKADHRSFREALHAAIELFRSRSSETELNENKLKIRRDRRR